MGTDKMSAKVSIIIPCKCIDDYTKQCIEYCKELDYNDFEIIVLPDVEAEPIADVRIIPTGAVTPGKKRNIGVAKASGGILRVYRFRCISEEGLAKERDQLSR